MNIWVYILRRTLYVIPILFGVTFIVFLLFNVLNDDPTYQLLGKHASEERAMELRKELGLDKPLYMQYLDVVKSAVTFDFGRSWKSKQLITEMIREGAPVSLSFTLPGFFISTVLGILISLLVAYYRGTYIDKFVVFVCICGMSISSLAYILFCQWYFAYELGLFEISGYEYGFPDFLPYVSLPIIIWLILSLGPDVRFFRTIMLDEIYQDYVRTARAKGLSEPYVLLKHVLKNALIPIITYVVIQIPFLLLGALLIETFFSIPGLGGILVKAIYDQDFPVVKAMTVFISVGYIIFNLLSDILYTVVDPRVRLK
ncbi:MAG: ABC transporter permease [Bacteriovoracaceae bacterium]|jgi:peptide/nickel transport system permease protein|nr:ABC transporter permease [Bacteriovoracaceae bacterium]